MFDSLKISIKFDYEINIFNEMKLNSMQTMDCMLWNRNLTLNQRMF